MSRGRTRARLVQMLGPIAGEVDAHVVGDPEIVDALRLLEREEGRSFELMARLVVEAGLELTSPIDDVFTEEEPTE